MENRWNERYSSTDFYYGTEPNDFLRENYRLFKLKGQILSLGEGEGRNAVFLASQGFDVTAVDGSRAGIEKLGRLSKDRGVSVTGIVNDLADFQIGESKWDGIISIWCHLPKALRSEVLKASCRGLKPGGYLLIESYTPKQLEFKTGGPPTADLMATLPDLRTDLAALEEVRGEELERNVQEGKGHSGRSAVVQFIGRRR